MMISDLAKAFDLDFIAEDKMINAVSTDTRTIQKGDLFIALKGENFDGHEYLDLAIEKGADALIVDRDVETDIPVFKVEDTRLALGQLAAYWRQQLDIKVVGLTGSNGKTTVKEMLTSILSETGSVTATRGNFNNDIGLPLTLLQMKPEHEFAVIEMGANHPGEIAYLTKITSPDVAVLNNAGSAHLEGFGSLDGVAHAKGEIFSGLNKEGIAVINIDDKYAEYWVSLCDQYKKIFFGLGSGANVSADKSESDYDGNFLLITDSGEIAVSLNVLGFHNLKNALAASSAALALGVDLESIKNGLEKFKGVKGRLQVNKAVNDSVIIDDSYNANPSSVRAAIDVLAAQKKESILILGDLGELGGDAEALHAELGKYAKEKNINQLMTLGDLSKFAVKGFGENGFSYDEKNELIRDAQKQFNKSIAVLVKGSRSMHMEDVVVALLENNNSGAASCC